VSDAILSSPWVGARTSLTYVAAFRSVAARAVPFRASLRHADTILIAQCAELLARHFSTVSTTGPRSINSWHRSSGARYIV
jgi:hypothetical protein